MCVLRAANPLRVRQSRPPGRGFWTRSSYRSGPHRAGEREEWDQLARRLTGYVVLAHDPAVPLIAADYWQHSLPFYLAAVDQARMLAGTDPVSLAAYRRLTEQPADLAAEAELESALTRLLADRPERAATCADAVNAADDNVYISYFRGDDCQGSATPVTLDSLRESAGRRPSRPARDDHQVAVIVPLRDSDGTARVRNIVACLIALRDQTLDSGQVAITVVEFDSEPRWRSVVAPLADHYVHALGTGRFNKSWAFNVAVRRTAGRAQVLCLLDADILADREFLERNQARFADPEHDAHLPHTEMLSLDPASTDDLIEQRGRTGVAPLASARGLLLRDVPGGCLWIRSELFHRIGGFDERYSGWGGEDEDMLVRVAAAGTAAQYDDVLLHLAHPRPPMRTLDGVPFNSHIKVGSWTGEHGYGHPAGPALLPGRELSD
jgi:hypothetical protein